MDNLISLAGRATDSLLVWLLSSAILIASLASYLAPIFSDSDPDSSDL
jgi:hypothetical protein